MGKSTISMAIFNSFLYVYQRVVFQPPNSRQGLSYSGVFFCFLLCWVYSLGGIDILVFLLVNRF